MRTFAVGQQVMVRNLRPGPDWIPGTILRQLGPLSYEVEVEQGLQWKRHVDHLRELAENSSTFSQSTQLPEKEQPDTTWCSTAFQKTTAGGSHEDDPPLPPEPSSSDRETTRRYPSRIRRPPDRLEYTHSIEQQS